MATACVAAGLLQAHHSLAGVYDMKEKNHLSGTVTSVKFTNPHGSLALAVKNQHGSSTEWVMTQVKFLPARDGSPLGFLKTMIMPDGRVIQISAGNPND